MKRTKEEAEQSLIIRFWPKVERRGDDECWNWIGARNSGGYGSLGAIKTAGRRAPQILATHVALMIVGKPRPSPKHIALHSCDNPSCVNPNHLRWGNHKQNFADMVERDRNPRIAPFYKKQRTAYAKMDEAASTLQLSKQNGKLSIDDVKEIRRSDKSALELSRHFCVSRRTITNVLKRISWPDID